MPSLLEQLLDLLPATSGGHMMNKGILLKQEPFEPASEDLSWAFRMPVRVQKRAAEAVENMPESDNVDDRRTSGKTLKGYKDLVDSLDKAGYTQLRARKAFARRPTAEEMRTLRAAGEDVPMQQRLMEATEPRLTEDQAKLLAGAGALPQSAVFDVIDRLLASRKAAR